MKNFISFIILFTILLYLGIVSYCCTLTFDNAEKIEEQQEQIDELVKKNHVQDLRLKILEQI